MSLRKEFKTNQVVWAKVYGYPWWPAMIVEIENADERPILVNFIGHVSHAQVKKIECLDFLEYYTKYYSSKDKKKLDSIKAAKRIVDGESTYEIELERQRSRRVKPSKSYNQSPRKVKPSIEKKIEILERGLMKKNDMIQESKKEIEQPVVRRSISNSNKTGSSIVFGDDSRSDMIIENERKKNRQANIDIGRKIFSEANQSTNQIDDDKISEIGS